MVRRMAAEQVEKAEVASIWNPCPVLNAPGTPEADERIRSAGASPILMPMKKERRRAIRTLRGWAISVLQDTGAIRECETHGWMQDRADPHARQRAFDIARRDPRTGVLTGCRRRRDCRGA